MTTRRTVLKASLAAVLAAAGRPACAAPLVTLRLGAPRHAISPFLFGSNEIGTMDGAEPSAEYDRRAGVTFRRLGGNLMTPYNWVNNASNAGHDWHQENGDFLPNALGLSAEARREPAAVIAAAHTASQAMGARSLITVPLAGFVAADADGPVTVPQTAPSPRFRPVLWHSARGADDPIDPQVADIPQLLRRLIRRYGGAESATGIHAYSLDNEPGLWAQNHPRIVPRPPTIRAFIETSLTAARVIRALDPAARIFGPASWGASEFQSFQNAPDWPDYAGRYDSFLAVYLDAFRIASEAAGARLLDALDIHWYPYNTAGDLLHTEKPELAAAVLAAPRTLTDPAFNEASWVASALPLRMTGGLSRPILPSLRRLIDRWYPGTQIAVSEFNFGGPGALASGLAVADALGRFAEGEAAYAAHWGNLAGWIGEAYRLYRDPEGRGPGFAGRSVMVACDRPELVAAHGAQNGDELALVLINKSEAPVRIALAGAPPLRRLAGFDAAHPACGALPLPEAADGTLELPARAARLAVLA